MLTQMDRAIFDILKVFEEQGVDPEFVQQFSTWAGYTITPKWDLIKAVEKLIDEAKPYAK